jgi:hypothetical protein
MNRDDIIRALDALEQIHRDNMTTIAEENWSKAIEALRAALATEQEPPCKTGSQCVGNKCERCAVQPEREWQGLTPEEAREISLANRPYVIDMVYALEAKLKEKNS